MKRGNSAGQQPQQQGQQETSDPIRAKLRMLEARSAELQKQCKYGESLDVLEEAFQLKISAYGEDSEEVQKTSEKVCELCNLIGMVCLTRERYEACLEFLNKALTITQHSNALKAVTYNNLACYYRRVGKVRTALDFLKKALNIEIQVDKPQSLADTHLNLCAVLSQLGKHSEALEHVLMSIVLLQEEHFANVMKKQEQQQQQDQDQQLHEEQQHGDEDPTQHQQQQQGGQSEDRVAVLAIAYHNMGVELEFLKRYPEAIQTYKKAVTFGQTYLGENHNLTENLRVVLASAEEQIINQKNKEISRKRGEFGKQDGGQKVSLRMNQAQAAYVNQNNYYPNNPNGKRATTAKGFGNTPQQQQQQQQQPQFRVSSAMSNKNRLPSMRNSNNNYGQNQNQGGTIDPSRSPQLGQQQQQQQQRPMTSNYPRGQQNQNNFGAPQYDYQQQGQQQQQQLQTRDYLQSPSSYNGNNQQGYNTGNNNNNNNQHNDMMNMHGSDNSRQEISPDQYSSN